MPTPRPFDLPRYLSLLPPFQDLPAASLARLAAHSQLRRLARGDTVFRAGEPCTVFNVAVTGQFKLFVLSAAGQEKVIEIAGPGCSLAEESTFSGQPYRVHAQAQGDALLLTLDKTALLAEVSESAGLARRLLSGVGSRMQSLVHDIESQALNSGVQRVVAYLVRDGSGTEPAPATVALPVSKATIASRLSLTPEYFSRVLRDLESAGLIRVDHRAIRINDRRRLAAYPRVA